MRAINQENYYGAGCGVMDRGYIRYGDHALINQDGDIVGSVDADQQIGVSFAFLESKSQAEVAARAQALIDAFAAQGIDIQEHLDYHDGGTITGAFDADGTYGIAIEDFTVKNLPASALPAVQAVVKQFKPLAFDLRKFMDENRQKYSGAFEQALAAERSAPKGKQVQR